MQIARLKSISARHLALVCQSLDLVSTLIPHIKAVLGAYFKDRQKLLLEEFDRVLRDYAEHNEKIFQKITNIVEEQIMKRFLEKNTPMEQIQYDDENIFHIEIEKKSPLIGIVQNTLKLHQVLQPILSFTQMKDIMTRIFDMFTQKLAECFQNVQPKTIAGKKK
jgi:vacuolar protein sorting-associated protein 54